MGWGEVSGNWVYFPNKKVNAIIHFLGGAFVAAAPQISYRSIIEKIAESGYIVVATPFVNTFDHFTIAREVLNRFETAILRLRKTNCLTQGYLPIYGIGHSMGCKLHLLICSLYEVERCGNILISFNNYPAKQAVPFLKEANMIPAFDVEFVPSPSETQQIIIEDYNIRRNLLIRFNRDDLDQTKNLIFLLQNKFPTTSTAKVLDGNHLTPLNQKLSWSIGESYTPIDAIGQWFNQGVSRNLDRLQRELMIWLNPMSAF